MLELKYTITSQVWLTQWSWNFTKTNIAEVLQEADTDWEPERPNHGIAFATTYACLFFRCSSKLITHTILEQHI